MELNNSANDLRLQFEVTPATLCQLFDNLGVTKYEKLVDGYFIVKDKLATRIITKEEEVDEKKTS